MKFLWWPDEQIRLLFENDDIIAVDKPYGFDTHTNESKAGQADLVQPGLIELFEKQVGHALHIVHRLDRTTTGVIVFAKTLDAAKKYQGYFRARETKKTYLFVTASHRTSATATCTQPIVRNGDELEASTDFTRLKVFDQFELWQATPHTGRNHQIRIHAAAVGLPLLGDEKYGGRSYPFICLHNAKIEFPDGVVIESRWPAWFSDLSLLNSKELALAMIEIDRRQRLFSREGEFSTDVSLRLIHPAKSEKRAALDLFGPRLVLTWYGEQWSKDDAQLHEQVARFLSRPLHVRFVSAKLRDAHAQTAVTLNTSSGEALPRWETAEEHAHYELRLDTGQSVGLYLDQRLARSYVKATSRGKSVLNLFAYTCGFSVAAAKGEAREIMSVDSNKNMLNWGRQNFVLNEIDASKSTFLCREAVAFLEQAKAKKQTYDLIVCDPPAFSRGEKGLFKIEAELEGLIKSCLIVLSQQGEVLVSVNSETLFIDDIRRMILKVQRELRIESLEITNLRPSLDFEKPDEAPSLKSFLISNISV